MTDVNGIHYEISTPVKNPNDGYYYQRYRQVDDKGNVVGSGDRMIRSARPDSKDGLFDPNWNVTAGYRGAYAMAGLIQALAGIEGRKPAWVANGAKKLIETPAKEPPEFLKPGYKDWPGTDKPWEGTPSGNNGLTKQNDGLGTQGMGPPGFDPRSGIPLNARDEALAKKVNLTSNEPFDPLNAAAGEAGNAQRMTTRTQLFQGPNGQAVADTTGWQDGANVSPFESAQKAVPFGPYQSVPYSAARLSGHTFEDQPARVLRLAPQPQDDHASSAFLRLPVDQSSAASSAPDSSDEMSDLLKLRSIIQAVGSRGLFPIQ